MYKYFVRFITCLIVMSLLLPTATSEASPNTFEPGKAQIDSDQAAPPKVSANWELVSTMPEPLGYFGTTQVNGSVYTFGGTNWDRWPLSTDVVRKFDPVSGEWQIASSMPEPVQQSAISLSQNVYIFGGDKLEVNGFISHTPLSSTWAFETTTNQWTKKKDMPAPRMFGSVAVLGGKFYVVGGSTSEGSDYKDTLFVYDPELDSWSEAAPMPTARMHLNAVASQGKIFVFGGWAGVGLSVVEVYDPSTNTWSTRPDMPITRWFDYNSVVEKNGKIILVGGCTGSGGCNMVSQVDVYDVASDTWSTLPDIPSARTGGGVTIVDGVLYSLGGYDYYTYSDAVYAYDLASDPLIVSGIEINQALGVQKDNEQNYIAGKDAVIRVLMDQPVAVNSATQSLEVKRGNTVVVSLLPYKNPSSMNSIDFYLSSDFSDCVDCGDSETYTFTANIDGHIFSKTVDFHKTKKIKIVLRPVTLVFDDHEVSLTSDEWIDAFNFLQKTYPIGEDNIEWVLGEPIRSPVGTLINSELVSLIRELQLGRGLLCQLVNFFCQDMHMAIMPPLYIMTSGGGILEGKNAPLLNGVTVVFANGSFLQENGSVYPIPPVDSMQASVAHEIAHSYGVGDEYNIQGATYSCTVNPPPAEYYDCGEINQPRPWTGPGTGSLIPASDHPFETNGRGLLGEKLSFMGSGAPQEDFWISKDVYSQLFSRLRKSTTLNQNQIEAMGRVILASGWIGQDDSLRLEPWLHRDGTLPEMGIGDYSIEAQDSVGTVLSTQFFDISFTDQSNPPMVWDEALFSVPMVYPIGTVRFVIKHGSTIISTREVASVLPSVNLTSPNGGETWDSVTAQTVTWEGLTDGSVFYTLLYSPDGITYDVLAVNLTTNSYEVDPAYLIGGVNARFRVLATDGVNTVEDTTDAPFTVLPKLPDAFIQYPQDGAVIPSGLSIILDGSGYDLEDGIITDESISWSSDIDGLLGNGANLLVDLSYGYHTLTLEVVDSDANLAQKSISVFIGSKVYLPTVIR